MNLSDLAAMGAHAVVCAPRARASAVGARARATNCSIAMRGGGEAVRDRDRRRRFLARGEADRSPSPRSAAASRARCCAAARGPAIAFTSQRPIGGRAAGLALLSDGSIEPPATRESRVRRVGDPAADRSGAGGRARHRARADRRGHGVHRHLATGSRPICIISATRRTAARRSRRRAHPGLSRARTSARVGIVVRDAVLHGGEEYALLFTSSLRESELSSR